MTGKRNERPIKGWNEEELVEMLAATRRINGEQDLAALLEVIAREAARLLDCDRSSIFFLDRDRCELWSRAALGTDEDLRFDARLGIAGEVALTGSAVVVQDAYSDARFNPSIDARLGYRTRCILAVPLFGRDGRVLGVFEVLNKRSGSFHQNDQKILVELGGHASLAMETALKFDELQKEKNALQKQNRMLIEEVRGQFSTRNILGMTRPIQQLIRKVEELRDNRVDVLITGESGTGKELVARAIHFSGGRAGGPFVALNCSALPENLVEAELFGIEKGVATGVDRRIGRFEAADGGTLFLDEIGDLSPAAQAKILRVLQERVLERVGGRRPIPVDVRILAATHRDLEKEIASGRFRDDLYYRLHVIHIRTPALREIRDDIPLLAQHFLQRACRELRRPDKRISPEAIDLLGRHDWPGNVRELENEMKRLAVTVRREVVLPEDVSEILRGDDSESRSLHEAVEQLERRLIREALQFCDRNRAQAAKRLGLSRQGLLKKMHRYGIE
jgi:Nif-specific regulatory protein